MALEFSDQMTFSFDPTAGRVQAFLKGFDITYNDGNHHVLRDAIDLDAVVDPAQSTTVNVTARSLLRDSPGNIDDFFSGSVRAVVIAQ